MIDVSVFQEHEALDGFEPEMLESRTGLGSERTGADGVESGEAQFADPSGDVGRSG